jgi:phosphatidylinositol kinase/protein kinase (PI-3  family)
MMQFIALVNRLLFVKGHEDLRQDDEQIMQFIALVNPLLFV